MRAKFEAEAAFSISGRGLVLAGWVIDGRIIRIILKKTT
jgi:hypothetical protein